MSHAGRPKLFGSGRAINVMLPADDWQSLRRHADLLKRERPGYHFADLVRTYIREGLDRDRVGRAEDREADHARQLRSAARMILKLAKEAEKAQAA